MASATLVDTNVLLRLLQPQHPQCATASVAIAELRARRVDLCIAHQNLVEFWAVATRPVKNNGLGMNLLITAGEMRALKGLFRLLDGRAGVAGVWEALVSKYLVSGKQAHDANLVAVMQAYAVTEILTFNVFDFQRFPEITILDPASI